MKIEKLTDNKIRIIVNLEDLEKKNISLHSLMSNSIESQSLLIDILAEAEKEVGFTTQGCRINIEALASSDGHFIFTITKDIQEQDNMVVPVKRKVNVRKKKSDSDIDFKKVIYKFATFDEFCNFCSFLHSNQLDDLNGFAKNNSLYLLNNTYYLVISNINLKYSKLKKFYALISEFAVLVSHNNTNFESKLTEHGKVIMKSNAIKRWKKYFV